MRIWDISAGYLNRASLLGEHRELHGMFSIIINNKKGYSKHPETLRWKNYIFALWFRHQELKYEMELRGYNEKSPLEMPIIHDKNKVFPEDFIDMPYMQYEILKEKYINKESGRIPLPNNAQEVWRNHKYSVMARDYNLYKEIGKKIANKDISYTIEEISLLMCKVLREKPSKKALRNSLQHIWGYLKNYTEIEPSKINDMSNLDLLKLIQKLTMQSKEKYIFESTAISELEAWLYLFQ